MLFISECSMSKGGHPGVRCQGNPDVLWGRPLGLAQVPKQHTVAPPQFLAFFNGFLCSPRRQGRCKTR